ncbi:MAG: ATP-binding cassette domain-containing protein [Oscillospiraceae bacterium]
MSLTACFQKKLGRFSLDVDFTGENGSLLGLLGASGSGKSMTLKCLAGIETPDSGHIALDGKVLFDSQKRINLPPQARQIGYLFQSYALFPNLTAGENITLALPKADRREALARLLPQFHLEPLAGHYPGELSGGQQQRVALARLLASRPKALLLDEPLSALDSFLRWQVELELSDVLSEFDGAAILVSHSRDEVYRLCSKVCVLCGGKSQTPMPVKSLFDAPGTLAACLLSGCKNVSAVTAGDGVCFASDWGVPLPSVAWREGVTHVGIRAHLLRPAETGDRNVLSCTVARVVDDVFSVVVMLQTPGSGLLSWELSRERWAALQNPTALSIALPPDAILLLKEEVSRHGTR